MTRHTKQDIEALAFHDPIVSACYRKYLMKHWSWEEMLLELAFYQTQAKKELMDTTMQLLMQQSPKTLRQVLGDPFKTAKDEDLESCPECSGHGRIKAHPSGEIVDCKDCNGRGLVPKHLCTHRRPEDPCALCGAYWEPINALRREGL